MFKIHSSACVTKLGKERKREREREREKPTMNRVGTKKKSHYISFSYCWKVDYGNNIFDA